MRSDLALIAAFSLTLFVAGCGKLPMPFERTETSAPPGGLLRPPPARIVIPPPAAAGLTDAAAKNFAAALAEALQALEVPATAAGIRNPEYSLLVSGAADAGQVRLTYSLTGADGAPLAAAGGPRAVPAGAWAMASPATLQATAREAAQPIARMLASIDAAQRDSAVGDLAERLPSAVVGQVTGAPGDGGAALDRAIRAALEREGIVVASGSAPAEFHVGGSVAVTPAGRAQQRVEIIWIVSRADGLELGRVAQLNEVPRGALDGRWGDVAVIVADQAATGMAEVIKRHRNGN